MTRKGARRRATRTSALPPWQADLRPVRGRCRGGTRRKPCRSEFAVVRVSIDFRDARAIDRLAVLACVECGRVWRRVTPPDMRPSFDGQRVFLTLLLPAKVERWRNRGHWHRVGDDAQELRDATMADLDTATRLWGARRDRADATRARAAARKAEREAAAHAATMNLLDRLHARDAERAAAEAEAAAREDAIA